MPDGVHQVRLAQAHSAINEKRVVGPRRRFGHGTARRMRELVRGADNERVERIAGARECRDRRLFDGGLVFDHGFGDRDFRNERRAHVFRHEGDRRAGALDFREGLLDDRRVVFRQPVPEQRVRDAYTDSALAIGHEGRRLEPGVEAVPVDLRLDAGEDLVPDIAGGHLLRFRGPFACLGTDYRGAVTAGPAVYLPVTRGLATFAPALFHNFFHSCGNLRGETLRPCHRTSGEGTVPIAIPPLTITR